MRQNKPWVIWNLPPHSIQTFFDFLWWKSRLVEVHFQSNSCSCLYLVKTTEENFKSFSSVFPFCVQLLPKSQWFNQQQAKLASVGRLWSCAGLVVWFRAMWTMECRKEPFILTHIPFICVTHACPISVFWGKSEHKLGPAVSFSILPSAFAVLAASNYNGVRGTGSLLCYDNNTDLVTALSPSFCICTEAFSFAHNQILSLTSTAVLFSLTTEL